MAGSNLARSTICSSPDEKHGAQIPAALPQMPSNTSRGCTCWQSAPSTSSPVRPAASCRLHRASSSISPATSNTTRWNLGSLVTTKWVLGSISPSQWHAVRPSPLSESWAAWSPCQWRWYGPHRRVKRPMAGRYWKASNAHRLLSGDAAHAHGSRFHILDLAAAAVEAAEAAAAGGGGTARCRPWPSANTAAVHLNDMTS